MSVLRGHRRERLSTRGRANALRAVLAGELPPEELTGEELHEAISLCLACKGCQSECPSSVDMARLKVEVLAHYYRRHGTPLGAAVMGRIDLLSPLGSLTAPLTNWVLGSRPMRALIQRLLGVDARRALPTFAGQTFTSRFAKTHRARESTPHGARVALFADTFTNHNANFSGRGGGWNACHQVP